jgi:hypothetical protein
VACEETFSRRALNKVSIPPHIPLALEALDHGMKKEGKNGVIVGMS